MTKNVKLTNRWIKSMKGRKFVNGKSFFTHAHPPRTAGEGYKPIDIANNPKRVPIYDSDNKIIRHEGSEADIATADIESYGCNKDEVISMPIAKADRWIAAGVMQEVS